MGVGKDFFEILLPISGKKLIAKVFISPSSRRLGLRFKSAEELFVSVPLSIRSVSKIEEFIFSNLSWIEQTYFKLLSRPNIPKQKLFDYLISHPNVFISGKEYTIVFEEAPLKEFYIFRENSTEIYMHLKKEKKENSFINIFLSLISKIFVEKINFLAGLYKVPVRKISIRDQKSRWASFSSSGCLSLNWRVFLLPPHLQHYIFLHELCHFYQPNHSDLFWEKMIEWLPTAISDDKEVVKKYSFLFQIDL